MIKLRIAISHEHKKYTENHLLEDSFIFSKTDSKLKNLVEKAIDKCGFEELDKVKITISFEM